MMTSKEQPKDEIPGYTTIENYDIMRKKAYNAENEVKKLEDQLKVTEQKLQDALIFRANTLMMANSVDILGSWSLVQDVGFRILKTKAKSIRVSKGDTGKYKVEVLEQ